MDLPWPLPPGISVNGCTSKESFWRVQNKIQVPSTADFCELIRQAGRGWFLYDTDVARVYCQLTLDSVDWPLICFRFERRFYMNVSLSFGLRWVASHYQDLSNITSRELRGWGLSLLNYIDDLRGGHPFHVHS